MPRYFTVEEANTALIIIRPIMEEIQTIRLKVLERQPEVWPVLQKAAGNGGSHEASLLALNFEQLDKLVHQILDMGVILKDINAGLLDFPSIRDDHEVYLCWLYGEEQIEFWHEIDAGFAGRTPIDPL
jgi:hypothetical protein